MKNLKTIAIALTVVFYFICNGKQKVDASKVVSIGLEKKVMDNIVEL
jgi:hypothetical protein